MSPFLRFTLIAFGIVLAVHIVFVLRRLIPILRRRREAERIKSSLNVFSVEAEVVEIASEKLNDLDTQFNVRLFYMVDCEKYYKDVVILNRHSLRIGQKITLLCDMDDPQKAIVQDGSEIESAGSLILNFWLDLAVLIYDMAVSVLEAV